MKGLAVHKKWHQDQIEGKIGRQKKRKKEKKKA